MTPSPTSSADLTRSERRLLAVAAARGAVAGAVRAITTWLLNHYIQ